jgi:Protein phosphatase 2C
MIVRSFIVPKVGLQPDECEDAFAVSHGRRRFAVADGMTDSEMSGEWAQLLVRRFVESTRWDRHSLRRLSSEVVSTWNDLVPPLEEVPWWQATKLVERGAHATLAVLDLQPAVRGRRGKTYRMVAIGDSCIFHLRQDRLIYSHPYSHPDQFLHRPLGLGTVTGDDNARGAAGAKIRVAGWRRKDRFLMMSDALALYFLRAMRSDMTCAREALPFARTQQSFEAWVADARAMKILEDDDTTLLEIAT